MLRILSSAATSGADAAAINTATVAAPTNTLIRFPRPFPDRAAIDDVRKYSRATAGKSTASADDSPRSLLPLARRAREVPIAALAICVAGVIGIELRIARPHQGFL